MATPNHIAVVSLALQRILVQAVPAGVEVTTLTLARAEQFVPSTAAPARVNLAFIRATVTSSLRDAPPRPNLVLGTPLPLEVQYLVTFYGEAPPAAEHSVERLLEAVLQHLHEHPVLTPADLEPALPDVDAAMSVNILLENLSDADLRDLFVCCRATWQPALVYRARLSHS